MEKWCQAAFKNKSASKKKSEKKRKKPYQKTWSVRARFASRWMAEMRAKKKKNQTMKTFSTCGFSSQRFSKIVAKPVQTNLFDSPVSGPSAGRLSFNGSKPCRCGSQQAARLWPRVHANKV
jgi:hypothetical protein